MMPFTAFYMHKCSAQPMARVTRTRCVSSPHNTHARTAPQGKNITLCSHGHDITNTDSWFSQRSKPCCAATNFRERHLFITLLSQSSSSKHRQCKSGQQRSMQLSRLGLCPRQHRPLQPCRRGKAVPAAATSNTTAALTPHSGYHWDGLPRRFFEGWYFKVTIPENGQSFALIYSVEDPSNPKSPVGGVGVQVMGPDDGYICQFSRDTEPFWASRHSLELGATLAAKPTAAGQRRLRQPVSEVQTDPCFILYLNVCVRVLLSCEAGVLPLRRSSMSLFVLAQQSADQLPWIAAKCPRPASQALQAWLGTAHTGMHAFRKRQYICDVYFRLLGAQ
eukprot:GHRQ01020221.1.p1 GENE.GHRQ01020221.1~~GHRQ01020221.1.p1  ORF type:complete len:334 (+),score=10.49 GHRQ01020221.1:821-1822(+)